MGRVKEALLAYQYDPKDFDSSDYADEQVDESIWDQYDDYLIEEFLATEGC